MENKDQENQRNKLIAPLLLELKQGCRNRAVVRGLDRFMVDHLGAPSFGASAEWETFRRDFAQYATMSLEERKQLVLKTMERLRSHSTDGETKRPGDAPPDLETLIPLEKKRAFRKTGIRTWREVLWFPPKWVLTGKEVCTLAQAAKLPREVFLLVCLGSVREAHRSRQGVLKVEISDDSARGFWVWFNRPYLRQELKPGRWVLIRGKAEKTPWGLQVLGQTGGYEWLSEAEKDILQKGSPPLVFYASTPTLDQKFWRMLVQNILPMAQKDRERISSFYTGETKRLRDAFVQVHRPRSLREYENARKRLAYEEVLMLQLFLKWKKKELEKTKKERTYVLDSPKMESWLKSLPFSLTRAQKKALEEIRADLKRPWPMNRLLQGDVGSGKTLIAAASLFYAVDSGHQAVLLAPTEILAQQHFETLEKWSKPLGISIELLTGECKAAGRKAVLERLKTGRLQLLVGTHAVLEKDVVFERLGMVVIDERHKFGVRQRLQLERKGRWPDSLMMTATPFPRALILTEYGDTDLSVLDELPPGRKAVLTRWLPETQKQAAYEKVRERILAGEKAYLVYPVLQEGNVKRKSALEMYRFLQQGFFHGFKIGLIHGRMKSEEKKEIMESFRRGVFSLLVATSVIEVGLDVPEATCMVVENADRFGLAQLHQLRGRIGRGEKQSYCFLIGSSWMTPEGRARLETLCHVQDGFRLAEEDLKLRGPGEILGWAQTGFFTGKFLDLFRDKDILEAAQREAEEILMEDPDLQKHPQLQQEFHRRFSDVLSVVHAS